MKWNLILSTRWHSLAKERARVWSRSFDWRWLIDERASATSADLARTHGAARSGAPRQGVTTHRFDLYNSGATLMEPCCSWRGVVRAYARLLSFFLSRDLDSDGWWIDFWPIASSTLGFWGTSGAHGDCWIWFRFCLGSVNNIRVCEFVSSDW